MGRRTFREDDGAINEIIGYILSFALSSVFLLIALTSFWTAQQNTDSVVTAVEMKTLANKVAGRVVEAGLLSQEFGNATLNVTITIPQDANGHAYNVTATSSQVTVSTIDGAYSASATTFKLDAVPGLVVSGSVYSSGERLVVSYYFDGTNKQIVIHG